jgi:hypothetical protein
MDGASYDFIVIPIVALVCLASWLSIMYWADAHPKVSPRPAPVLHEQDAIAGQVNVPRQATAPPKTALSKTVPSKSETPTPLSG